MSWSASVAITTALSIFVVVGIVGNCLVCAIIKKNRVMRYLRNPEYVKHTLFKIFSEHVLRYVIFRYVIFFNFVRECVYRSECEL